MPDWLDAPNWFVFVVIGAVVTWMLNQVMPALSRWARYGLRKVNHYRKFVIGKRRTRAHVIVRWRNAPAWVLRATVYRWFRDDPQGWAGSVRRVCELHNSEQERGRARDLLWVEKPATDLKVGDVYQTGGECHHVLALRPLGDQIEVVTSAGWVPDPWSSRTSYSGTLQVRVNRGWCPLGSNCAYCSIKKECGPAALTDKLREVGHWPHH